MSIALAAETFPEKVAAAVFVTAFLPDCTNPRSQVIEKVTVSEPGPGELLLRARPAEPDAVQRGQVRRGEQGVRGLQAGSGHDRGVPAHDDRRLPRGGGEGDRRRRPHGHVLRAG
ncbi:Methylesterase 3 [Zea mays]|uniref:Methylesterase 3 n=1 Tax=Zea mays TaxID=4577 RepID=A0A1D6FJ82_MAIZE|nr:Methylesterase 3 [Zea mays]